MARVISVRPHYVRHNEGTRVPRRFIYLDTEAHDDLDTKRRLQTWRLGVTAYDRTEPNGDAAARPTEWRTHSDPADLWAYVDTRTKSKTRVVVMAHNLGYDLRISDALHHLPALGYKVAQMGITGRSVTMTWKRETRTIVMVDSTSWWPMALHKVGEMLGMPKLKLPAWDDTDAAWEARCRRDVEILKAANDEMLKWIEDSDLGNWQKTGAGMAWANWRHKHYTHRVLVHADESARHAEVAAIATARVEAWQHGVLIAGPFTEWDLPLAYPRIATDIRVPTTLQGHVSSPSEAWLHKLPTYRRALVHATITTTSPVLPLKVSGYWCWPVGTFAGWWWDSELTLAIEADAAVTMHEAITYQAAMALKQWGEWVTAVAEDTTGTYSPLQRATVKHWSRALIGRFGAKYPLWTEYGEAPEPGLDLGECWDTATRTLGKVLTMGDRLYLSLEESYVADACPAIMGAIMAECRVRLWRLIQAAGPENVVYMDTDSVITNPAGTANLRTVLGEVPMWGVRPKRAIKSMEILGPRQVILKDETRLSGVPKSAKRVGAYDWKGELWEGFAQAIASGRPDTVKIAPRLWHVTPTDRRRVHLAGGATAPVSVDQAQMAAKGRQIA